MMIRAVFLGLVLTSFVLALPTVREETALERERTEVNELDGKIRRELSKDGNEELDRKEEEERRRSSDKEERRRETEEKKEEERRGTDKEEVERRRDVNEEKEERRRETEERKEEERRGADKEKGERRREAEEKEKKEERRRGADKEEMERRRETDEKKDKKEERRETEEKEERRREAEKKEKEERREAEKKDKKEERRETEEKKDKKEERREAEKKEKEERREAEKKDKKEERREAEKKEKEERREAEKKEKEERRREAEEKDKKEERRRGADKEEMERRRETDEKKDKKEERRETEEKEERRREAEKKERREAEEKEERRREAEKKEKEERRETEKEKLSAEREKRRPTPAIKEERRELNMDRMEDKNTLEMTQEKRERRETTTSTEKSPAICESVTDFKYFQKIENEPTKYIQCDPWGTGKVKTCPEGLLWNEWTLVCDAKDHIRNMTLDLSKFSVTTAARPVVNCSAVGMECLNGGSCVQSTSGDYKCSCRTDYTGQFCESRVDLTDITHEILNSTFSVVEYREHLKNENLTMNIAYYEKFKDQLDNLTYTELIRYLSFYKDGEVRFDTLVNSLVEDILENIYPDAEYLSVFNATEQNVVAMVQMIPSLLSYARYSFERYQDVFAQYQHVLTTLSKQLNATLPHIREEATQYTVLTRIFLNQTVSLMNSLQDSSIVDNTPVDQPIQLTEADIKKSLEYNYNETLKAAEKLVSILETFQNSVVKELTANPASVINLTLGQAKFPGAEEMLGVLNQVSVASSHIWESLVNYGFWYLTNLFSSVETTKVESIKKFGLNLNKF